MDGTSRWALILLATMALALAVAAVPAVALTQLDQRQASSDGRIQVTSRGAYQTFTAGKGGTLDKISLYLGCCGSEGTPTSDLRVEVRTAESPFTTLAQASLPASSFTNDGTLGWREVPFGSAAPTVQAGQRYNLWLTTWGAEPDYLWGYNSAGGYPGGELTVCFRVSFPDGSGHRQCQVFTPPGSASSVDAAFETYVTDTTPPRTTIDVGPSGPVNYAAATFRFSSNEPGSAFRCSLDGAPFDACPSLPDEPQTANYSDLSEGFHTFEVKATDSSGNGEFSAASRAWTVDTIAPTVSPTAPQGNTVSGTSVELKAEAADDSSGVAEVDFFVYNNEAWSWVGTDDTVGGTGGGEYSVSWDLTSVADGPQSFFVRAKDRADNYTPSTATQFFVENTVAPTIQGSSPVPGKTGVRRGSNVSVAFSEPMNASTLNRSNVVLRKNGTGPPVSAAVNPRQNSWVAEVDPSSRLTATTRYMVTLRRDSSETGVQDEAGNLLDGLGEYALTDDQRYVYFWFKTGRR